MTEATTRNHLEALSEVVGPAHVREGVPADAIDDVAPALVVTPGSAAETAAVLAWATREGVRVVISGGGTRRAWGRTPAAFDVLLSLGRLSRVLHHEPGDLTVSVEAGIAVVALNRALGMHGQRLPIDAPDDGATIGGALATNDSGPLRHRHGTPRDLLIGVQVATADGRVIKAGGNVVKNVAGYDLGRLMCGSFGSLGAIVGATFKLAPVARASSTLVSDFGRPEAIAQAAVALTGSQLDPECLDLRADIGGRGSFRLLVRFAGPAAANDGQIGTARLLLAPAHPAFQQIVTDTAEARVWEDQRRVRPGNHCTVVRLSWLPAALPAVLETMDALARSHHLAVTLTARAALGAGRLQLDGAGDAQVHAISELRARTDLVSHVVVTSAAPGIKHEVDVWGQAPDTLPLLTRIKRTMDPAGILGAGRGMI
jgi:glycolate oxidase FAD binding subunit